MTVFNTAAYVAEAIDSVLAQSFSDFEFIIVDDCSTDGSWSIVREAASHDRRIVAVRRTVRGGASAGLNQGLGRARGDFIVRQDSDDVSLPSRLAEQVAFLEERADIGAVGTQALLIDETGTQLDVTSLPEADEEIQVTLMDSMCFIGPTVMVRRSAFEKAGLMFDEALSGSEDYDLCLRLGEVARLANTKQALYRYRQHPSSVSRSQRHKQLLRKAAALEKAVRRRFGPVPQSVRFANVARDYLRAAVVGHALGDPVGQRECVAKALALHPEILRRTSVVEKIVRRYTPRSTFATALHFTCSLFDGVLPPTRRLAWLKRRLVAELHVKEVLGPTTADPSGIRRHLCAAVRANPAWLMNPGVLSLLVRHSLATVVPGTWGQT